MTSLSRRLRRDLPEIADRAVVSDEAWHRIVARLEETAGDDASVDMPSSPVVGRPGPRRFVKSGPVLAGLAAAAALAMAAVAGSALLGDPRDERIDTAQEPTEQSSRSTHPAEAQPESVFADYLDAVDAGDAERAMAFFAPGATLRADDRSIRGSAAQPSLEQWTAYLAWHAGQGSTVTNHDCEVTAWSPARSEVRCVWNLEDAVSAARGGPGPVVVSETTIEGDRIVALDETYVQTNESQSEFLFWMMQNHPDKGVLFVDWSGITSSETAYEFGEQYAELVTLWATEADN